MKHNNQKKSKHYILWIAVFIIYVYLLDEADPVQRKPGRFWHREGSTDGVLATTGSGP